MRKILLLKVFCALMLMTSISWAQTRTVSGKVTSSDDGAAVPGVNIIVKGTTNGTTTDANGSFNLSVPNDGGTLVFTFIGMATQEVAIGERTIIDVQMTTDSKQLSEVVVVGYGTQERKDLTGSLASVKGSDISNLASPSFDQQLAGRAAGVNVSIPSGLIGQAPVIRIRGVNSISNGADPLIVVDNMPITTGSNSAIISNNALADINPNDIESFEVLKDGSATAIYGSRGANGVILITTKKGHKGSGKTNVSYDNYFGWANTFKQYNVLNADQFVQIQNEKFANAGAPLQAVSMKINGQPVNTDWQKQVFRTGFIQNHAVSINGATDKTSYFFSLGWTDQKGATVSNALQRYTFRANFDHKATNWLSFGTDIGLTRTKTIGLNAGSNALSGNIFNALNEFPNVPVYNANGAYNISGNLTGSGANLANNDFALPNIGYVLAHNVNNSTAYRLIGNTHVEATVLKDFKIRTQIGVDALLNDDFFYRDPKQGDGYPSGSIFQQYSPTIRWNWQNTINYSKILAEDHKINITGGFEYQKATFSNYSAFGQQLSNSYFGQNNIIGGTLLTQQIGGDYQENGFSSYFGRANYSYKDKYLLQGTFRSDALSSLAPNVRTGFFPGASLGWRISNEEFFKSARFLNSVSALKLRASYAQVGNSFISSNYPYADTFTGVTYGIQNGLSYGNTGNINLKWETSKKLDFGFDLGLLNDKITVTADYYQNKIDGLILNSPTAPSLGIPGNAITKNIGQMENSGFELRVATTAVQRGEFTWNVDVNFATNHNKVTGLDKSGDILKTYQVTRVGESIGSFLGYIYEGVNKANGNPLYLRGDGKTIVQGNISDQSYYNYDRANPSTLGTSVAPLSNADKVILGKSTPTWFGGLNNTFAYKGFDLTIFTRFSGGNKIMNLSRQGLLSQNFTNNGTEILNRWKSSTDVGNGSVPKLVYNRDPFINLTNNTTTRFLEKGDFFRIQNIVFGYTLPKAVLEKAKINKLRFFAQLQNVLLITNYKGIDPESNLNPGSNTQSGLDSNVNPQQRTLTLGLNLGF